MKSRFLIVGVVLLICSFWPDTSRAGTVQIKADSVGQTSDYSSMSEEETEDLKIMVILLLVFAFISVFGLTFMVRSHRELKRQYKTIDEQKNEIARKNDDLAFKNESLEEINIEKNNMLSVVAHDLKTPLGNILGLLGLIKLHDDNLSADQTRYMDMISEVLIESTHMVDNMLDVHKIESELHAMTFTDQNASELVKMVIKVHDTLAESKQIELVSEDFPENIKLKTDKQYFKQILSNILKNAIEFSPDKSKVTITIEDSDSSVAVSIVDAGPGIPEGEQKRLFAGYRKGKIRVGEGAESSGGFGLVIVMRLVEKLKAKINVVSSPEEGSTFTIEFPK